MQNIVFAKYVPWRFQNLEGQVINRYDSKFQSPHIALLEQYLFYF